MRCTLEIPLGGSYASDGLEERQALESRRLVRNLRKLPRQLATKPGITRLRRGEYVNRSVSTVADYLAEWVETHASTVKPKTLAGYRHDIDHYIVPRIGRMRLQALRPAVLSKLYRDLAEHGGRDGGPLSAWTVSHIHRTLRKALADAVHVEQLLAVNPAVLSKRPRDRDTEPGRVWTIEQLDLFLTTARSHRLYAFYHASPAYHWRFASNGELLHLRWQAVDLDAAEVTFGGSTAVVRGQRVEGTTKGGRSRVVSSIDSVKLSPSCGSTVADKQRNSKPQVRPGLTLEAWYSPPSGANRFIPTP